MPFTSEKQRRWMWANKPKMARKWAHKYGSKVEHEDPADTGEYGKPAPKKRSKRIAYRGKG